MATNATTHQTRILTRTQVGQVRYALPKGWYDAAGILKNKKKHPLRYQRTIRKEWGKRLKRIAIT